MGNLLLKKNSRFIGQGITGFEGSRALPRMLNFGTKIVAGVTPGKGGQTVESVPIFNSVKEAIEEVGEIDGSVQFVPPLFTKAAVQEVLEAGIKFVLVSAEKVPTKDGAIIYALAKKHQAAVLGPNSVGLINPHLNLVLGLISVGAIEKVFNPGNVAIISKSGSMTAEIGLHLKNNGLGVSWAAGIGGDIIASTDFGDFLLELENDPLTKASVIFGELGGTYEERVASLVKEGRIKKSVIAFISGEFTLSLPSEVQFGHAGAIIEGKRGMPDQKRKVLKEAGVKVADSFDEIAKLVKESI
ncbi:succinate--CoA ligase subunit alpha [Candidatus Daviesbacteria bacterium]|nr:succinate--CoA ligase subunit alpha [Candidatus Daviesbacteria bacterium]